MTKILALAGVLAAAPAVAQILSSEFIADPPPTRASHASTVCDSKNGLVAAWFGGAAERSPDCVIWQSRFVDGRWLPAVEVARGNEDGRQQLPCWNPVLFEKRNGPLYLFYKVGPSPSKWWGRVMRSDDGGITWGRSRRLPDGFVGPVRNKPVELPSGTILCGASTEDQGWRVHMEWTVNPFARWDRTPPLNSALNWGAIQPTILRWPGERTQILCRTKQQVVSAAWCTTDLRNWGAMSGTMLPNPNSAIDAVMLENGQALLVYNPTTDSRSELSIALSADGTEWRRVLDLEKGPGEYSYPAVIQDRGGRVHVTYTWKREAIRHVVVDPAALN
ncbi:MAG: exo-alpha-sialidase [Verrucomicrobiae bacterium]|nr:exo-alpha-sialidase [Verrucomicrobiae bacterium]